MAQNKSDKFNATRKRTAKLAKALAHPARIAILEILGERVAPRPIIQNIMARAYARTRIG